MREASGIVLGLFLFPFSVVISHTDGVEYLRKGFGVVALVLGAFLVSSCVFDGIVLDDETSISRGPSRDGVLHRGARLPVQGDGYQIPERWSRRGLNFGIDELVSMIVSTGRALKLHNPQMVLTVGDLSPEFGGRSQWHRSHQTGRDVDLLFFVRDRSGTLLVSETMYKHEGDGRQVTEEKGKPKVFFDFAANWALVDALINNPIVDIQYIFIHDGLRQGLLEYATEHDVAEELILRASHILRQPSDSAPHNDHMHVRVYCAGDDLRYGCENFGRQGWHKRDLKYERRTGRMPEWQTLSVEGIAPSLAFVVY